MSQTLSLRSWSELLLLAVLWGGSFLAIRLALVQLPVETVVALRVGLAALVLWLWLGLQGFRRPTGMGTWAGIAGMALFNNVLPFTLITWGQQHIASGLASILNAGTALWGILIAALVFPDERLTARRLAGVGLGLAGVATAVGPASLASFDPGSLGQWAVIAATLSYGISGAWGRRFLKGLAPQVSAASMLTVSAAVMVPVALLRHGVPPMSLAPQTIGAVVYLAVGASAIAYLLFYRLLARAGAGNTSLVTLLLTPVAILLGAIVLGESLAPRAYAGFAILAGGLLVLDGRVQGLLRRRTA